MALRIGESPFGRLCRRASHLIDCAIPIAVVIALIIGMASVIFGLVQ